VKSLYLLDTGWIVRHLRGVQAYTETLLKIGAPQLALSILSLAELYEGVYRARDPAAAEHAVMTFVSDKTILPITEPITRLFGQERARLRQQNQLIGDIDLLIAATTGSAACCWASAWRALRRTSTTALGQSICSPPAHAVCP